MQRPRGAVPLGCRRVMVFRRPASADCCGRGRVLGPKGLMPSPKAGTVPPDAVNAVKEFAAGKTEYRNDDGGNIHCIVGKMSFSEEDLLANLNFFLDTIEKIRPASVKGIYMKRCVISGTMTPSVEVETS